MRYDLSNALGTYVRFTGSGWDLALAVAKHYGWNPAGVPVPPDWDERRYGGDGYHMNADQQVAAPDAAELGSALDRALAASDLADQVLRIQSELGEEVSRHDPAWRDRVDDSRTRERADAFRAA
jgi:hypothetical protein